MTTKAERVRFRKMFDAGCICCKILGIYTPPQMHHILVGGHRSGHLNTIPLCLYHHQGGMAPHEMGPSLAHGSKPFVAHWGTERELLEMVNEAIA